MAESVDCGIAKSSVAFASKGEDIFHRFPEFSTEIRLRIWQQAIDALPGRIIDVTSVTHRTESGHEKLDQFISHRACPRLAGVNHEARAEVFRVYTPLFPLEAKHSFIAACLEKDTILLSTVLSTFTGNRQIIRCNWQPNFFMKFYRALTEEKRREFRTLAFETGTNWQWGKWSISQWRMFEWLPTEPGSKKLLLRQLFPNIEKVVFAPPIEGSANAHTGELQFVGPESGT